MLKLIVLPLILAWVGANFVWWRRRRTVWERAVYVRCNSCDHISEFRSTQQRRERVPVLWSEVILAVILCWFWVLAFKFRFWTYPLVQLIVWQVRRRVIGGSCALCQTEDIRVATRDEYERVMTMSPHR